MKKLFNTLLMIVALTLVGVFAQAQDCTSVVLNVSSYSIEGDNYVDALWAWDSLIVTTNVAVGNIYRITIANSDPTIQQKVDFYQWGRVNTATSSVKMIWSDQVGATGYSIVGSTVVIAVGGPQVQETFFERFPLRFIRGLAIKKSNPNSTVTVSVQYR